MRITKLFSSALFVFSCAAYSMDQYTTQSDISPALLRSLSTVIAENNLHKDEDFLFCRMPQDALPMIDCYVLANHVETLVSSHFQLVDAHFLHCLTGGFYEYPGMSGEPYHILKLARDNDLEGMLERSRQAPQYKNEAEKFINHYEQEKLTALDYAVKHKNAAMAEFLIPLGAKTLSTTFEEFGQVFPELLRLIPRKKPEEYLVAKPNMRSKIRIVAIWIRELTNTEVATCFIKGDIDGRALWILDKSRVEAILGEMPSCDELAEKILRGIEGLKILASLSQPT